VEKKKKTHSTYTIDINITQHIW